MKLYLSIIGVAMLAISVWNILFETASWYYVVIAVVWCTALQFAFDGLIAIIVKKLPDKWFGVDNPFYYVTKLERKVYKKLKVKLWKDKVWELGGLGGFSKKELKEPNNPEYIEKFIIECNKGVLTHRLAYPVGFAAMLTLPFPCNLTIALPVAIVNLYLSVLPTLVLRCNTPALQSILKRLRKKTENKPITSQ